MKSLKSLSFLLILIGGFGFAIGEWISSPILFTSKESKTKELSDVFNRIKFSPGWTEDVWVMQQSHQGLDQQYSKWDRLLIRVDKTQSPAQTYFYQLTPDIIQKPLKSLDYQGYKVSCFSCHASGPRAIRIDWQKSNHLTWIDRLKVFFLNLRIKLYFNSSSNPGYPKIGKTTFKMQHPQLEQKLKLDSCIGCHKENGIREPLRLHHWYTIKHLVKSGAMPPWPHTISKKDKEFLKL